MYLASKPFQVQVQARKKKKNHLVIFARPTYVPRHGALLECVMHSRYLSLLPIGTYTYTSIPYTLRKKKKVCKVRPGLAIILCGELPNMARYGTQQVRYAVRSRVGNPQVQGKLRYLGKGTLRTLE